MLGAIAGDIIGSVYEGTPIKKKNFPLFNEYSIFTDDSVLTAAIAYAIIFKEPYSDALRLWGQKYPDAGYGGSFREWLFLDNPSPYNSYGNGSAMRVSPVGFAFNSEADVLNEAKKSAEVTHNHPEGIKGAQATALSVFLAGTTHDKTVIRARLTELFNYDLTRTCDSIRPLYQFDISCQGTVPEAIIAFLDSQSYEDAIRNAISLGGDSDTLACITGGIAHAYYETIPKFIVKKIKNILDQRLWNITSSFCKKYGVKI
jgi:ADP-ribosylglycohydrolase